MIKFSGSVLFIDNNCLVYLFEELYYANQNHLDQALSVLISEYDQIWIPATVENEFLLKRKDKKRAKLLKRAMDSFSALQICPIKVSKSEIVALIGNVEEDAGEADAVLQMNKGNISESHIINRMVFFTQDKKAIEMARQHGHECLFYNQFRESMIESGIILP